MINSAPAIESIIKDYIEHKERSIHYGRKKLDSEKEYNRLLTKYDGEAKNYSLGHANKIYASYLDMQIYGEESRKANESFNEAEEKLREIGQILFEATINAEILLPGANNQLPATRSVTVSYNNGNVMVS